LQRRSELSVVIDDQDGLELKTVDNRLKLLRKRLKFSHRADAA